MSDETKVSVEEMIATIEGAALMEARPNYANKLAAARDYILAAQAEIAEMRAVLGPKCPYCPPRHDRQPQHRRGGSGASDERADRTGAAEFDCRTSRGDRESAG
jgi:hypothetical protein